MEEGAHDQWRCCWVSMLKVREVRNKTELCAYLWNSDILSAEKFSGMIIRSKRVCNNHCQCLAQFLFALPLW